MGHAHHLFSRLELEAAVCIRLHLLLEVECYIAHLLLISRIISRSAVVVNEYLSKDIHQVICQVTAS